MRKMLSCLFPLIVLSGCQAIPAKSGSRSELPLASAMRMQVGKTTKNEAIAQVGQPDRILDLGKSETNQPLKLWVYFANRDESSGRLSLSFPEDSDILNSITFGVRDGDREQDLEQALSQFKTSHFVKVLPKHWDNPHSSPDEVFYQDAKGGLSVVYLQSPKQVVAITWTSPSRTTTSEAETKTAQFPYCIVGICAGQP